MSQTRFKRSRLAAVLALGALLWLLPMAGLIAWQGWYREWIRPGWLATPKRTEPFVPGDAAVLTALRSWTSQKDAFERAFYSTSIPVR